MEFSFDKVSETLKKKPVLIIGGVLGVGAVIYLLTRGQQSSGSVVESSTGAATIASNGTTAAETASMIQDSNELLAETFGSALSKNNSDLVSSFQNELGSLSSAFESEVQNTNQTMLDYASKNQDTMDAINQSLTSQLSGLSKKYDSLSGDISNIQDQVTSVVSSNKSYSAPVYATTSGSSSSKSVSSSSSSASSTAQSQYEKQKAASDQIRNLQSDYAKATTSAQKEAIHKQADSIGYAAGLQSTKTTKDGTGRTLVK
ncbi:MAG TPA: hypothetical protein DIW31_08620 [Bacteroidales bacterium]|nr:hypothetical protein [Bacteroidales bacterium]